ncbi:MAG TPA: UDP-2,3-diacylglucosamine diphosphatase [Gammaproteobacteria bacterium]
MRAFRAPPRRCTAPPSRCLPRTSSSGRCRSLYDRCTPAPTPPAVSIRRGQQFRSWDLDACRRVDGAISTRVTPRPGRPGALPPGQANHRGLPRAAKTCTIARADLGRASALFAGKSVDSSRPPDTRAPEPMSSCTHMDAQRTVWISDVHLGSRSCRASLLLDFLRRTRCDVLYLVGDIIDLESLRHDFYWPESHNEVLRTILQKSFDGTRVIYIPGNHDYDIRRFAGALLGNIEIAAEKIHTTANGRRLLVLHGDRFDCVVRGTGLGVRIGAHACRALLELNRFVHWLHDVTGRPYWSLAQHVKSRFGFVRRYVERFQRATVLAARDAGVDGVVCGHIHKAEIADVDGLLYCNDGDWVESCTALVEDRTGELSLVAWRPSVAAVAASVSVSVAVVHRKPLAARLRRHVAVPSRLFRARRARRPEARGAGARPT